MGKKTPQPIQEFVDAVEQEGLDYSITDKCDTDAIVKHDPVLAGALYAYCFIRHEIVERLKRYGLTEDA